MDDLVASAEAINQQPLIIAQHTQGMIAGEARHALQRLGACAAGAPCSLLSTQGLAQVRPGRVSEKFSPKRHLAAAEPACAKAKSNAIASATHIA